MHISMDNSPMGLHLCITSTLSMQATYRVTREVTSLLGDIRITLTASRCSNIMTLQEANTISTDRFTGLRRQRR